MLSFIGTGSAFNTALGNNGAYLKSPDDKNLFMIDCGETTFERLKRYGVLEGIEHVHVFITHFHPDHVGSLGTLVFNMYYKDRKFRPGVTIYTPDTQSVLNLFHVNGVKSTLYNLVRLDLGGHRNIVTIGEKIGRIIVTPVRTEHDPDLKVCYGYLFEFIDFFKGTRMYYSGDSRSIPPTILRMVRAGELDYLYQDTQSTSYNGYVHLPLEELTRLIPNSKRYAVWCMHIDEGWNTELAKSAGFKTVKGFD